MSCCCNHNHNNSCRFCCPNYSNNFTKTNTTTQPQPQPQQQQQQQQQHQQQPQPQTNTNTTTTFPRPQRAPQQYTPNNGTDGTRNPIDMISEVTELALKHNQVISHDPDGALWNTYPPPWDGIPLDDVSGKTKEELCDWIGKPYAPKGLRERFYEVNPFADNLKPTVAEIDEWNIEVIRHFRKLLGIDIPVRHSPKLYLEARWACERKFSEIWDSSYSTGPPGCSVNAPKCNQRGNAWGPCFDTNGRPVDIASGHCGDYFFPETTDRMILMNEHPYDDRIKFPELTSEYILRHSQTTGSNGCQADVPWSLKMGYVINYWICKDGLTGHAGPFINPTEARKEFGCAWWYKKDDTWINFKGKWR